MCAHRFDQNSGTCVVHLVKFILCLGLFSTMYFVPDTFFVNFPPHALVGNYFKDFDIYHVWVIKK